MKIQTMRGIPPVHRFLSDPRIEAYQALLGKAAVKRSIAATLQHARLNGEAVPPYDALHAQIIAALDREHGQSLSAVINATGVILHTNLGRAPMSQDALRALAHTAGGYSNLEYDVTIGERGSRYARATTVITDLTGAQDALVVNNCAAAVLLLLDTFAKQREVVIARSQLVEVGGGFRLPDILARSGAALVEVGATNKVYLQDFERALTPGTALLMRCHPSNYRITGFTAGVEPRELAELGRRAGIPVVEDLGSGALVDLRAYGLPYERTVQDAVNEGIDLIAFSGDKLLGGPQAGIIVGRAALVARLRSNPLLRALRVDKMTLAALIATLRLYSDPQTLERIPLFRMLGARIDELRARAQRYIAPIQSAAIVQSVAYAGGGSFPQDQIPSIAVTVTSEHGASRYAEHLRRACVPIIARIEQERVVLDLRTIPPEDDPYVIRTLQSLT
ncbi:MAG TPA: L-seryl-tRNA(Sec) selenium transferase [Candidatus Baltobacteraceae bacterium]|jgi:L-seryl-tRNA(Ser) seleniumtransferase|nr:L-seryl-tRNA(Sec) selenium transferase [Candidatus Baltobacteraceae bacterium]